MDASSYITTSDQSNTSDILRQILETLKVSQPALRSLSLTNPGNIILTNEKRIAALKKRFKEFKLPEYSREDVISLTQSYNNYLHSQHKLKLASQTRDTIVRDRALLSAPSASDICPPSVTNCVIDSSKRSYGLDPETGLMFPSVLKYSSEVNWDDFSQSILVKSSLSNALNMEKTLLNLFNKGESYGMDMEQLRQLALSFASVHLVPHHPILQQMAKMEDIANYLIGLVNTNDESAKIREKLASVVRSPGVSLAESASLLKGLTVELLESQNPLQAADERAKKAEGNVKRILHYFVEKNASDELRQYCSYMAARNQHIDLSQTINFLSQLEQRSQFKLKTAKSYPASEQENLLMCHNNMMFGREYGNRMNRYGGEKYHGGAARQGRENYGYKHDYQSSRSPSPFNRYGDGARSRPDQRRGRDSWRGGRSYSGDRSHSRERPRRDSADRGRRGDGRRDSSGGQRRSSYDRRPSYERRSGYDRREDGRQPRSRSGSRDVDRKKRGGEDGQSNPGRTRAFSPQSRGRQRSPSPYKRARSKSPLAGDNCFKCGGKHLQDSCKIYPGARYHGPVCPIDGLLHPEEQCKYAPAARGVSPGRARKN